VGWLFLAISGLPALGFVGGEYAFYGIVTRPGSIPAPEVGAWFAAWGWAGIGLVVFLVLLFPTGKPVSPRWKPVAWLAGAGFLLGIFALAFTPGPLEDFKRADNPFGIPGAQSALDVVGTAGLIMVAAAAVLALASLTVRFRRSRGTERQQLKWFLFAASLLIMTLIAGGLVPESLSFLLFITGLVALPAAATVAILKYRLYDIDRIINKTLVYGLLTALLGGAYAGVVFGIGGLVSDNSVVVAVATLIVAALFRPARARVQGLIDRRFYRRRYDAARTLEAFNARLRNEVDLGELNSDLLEVVRETMQPAHASLWLRGAAR
jgi:hypothetical protein